MPFLANNIFMVETPPFNGMMEKKTEGITMEQIIQYIIAATLIMLTVISILNYGAQKDIEAHIENIARRMNVNRSEDILDEIERELNNRKG